MTVKDGIVWIVREGSDEVYYGAYNSEKIAVAAMNWFQGHFPEKHFYYTPDFIGYYWTEQIEKEMEEAYQI